MELTHAAPSAVPKETALECVASESCGAVAGAPMVVLPVVTELLDQYVGYLTLRDKILLCRVGKEFRTAATEALVRIESLSWNEDEDFQRLCFPSRGIASGVGEKKNLA